jgi:hypothetical protein
MSDAPSTSWAIWAWQAYRDGRLVEADTVKAQIDAAVKAVEVDNARLRAIGNELAESIEGNYYLPGVATRWRAALTGKETK